MLSNISLHGVIAFGLLGLANAHMKMASPVPFDVDTLDNSPLKPDGSDYPCKSCGYKISSMNKIPVNEPVLLKLDGSAIHGGGSCQIAISMDKEPTKDSTFKVIQTYEGDCPPAAGTGLTFNIPKDFPTTERATLAWTWFNKIGNREMYMNLAPIEITGGSDKQDYYESLPDLFKANIPATDCTTPETSDPTIPNPGEFLIQASTYKAGAVTGPKCGAAGSGGQSGKATNLAAYGPPAKDSNQVVAADGSSGSGSSGSSGSGSSNGGSGGSSPSAPSTGSGGDDGMYHPPGASSAQPTSTAASSAAPSTSAPATSASSAPVATEPAPIASSAAPSTFSTYTVPASSAASPPYPTLSPSLGQGASGPSTGAPAASGSPSPSGSSSSGSSGSSGQCTTDGAVVCNGPTQFGLCDHGSVVWMEVSAGTRCENGAILKRSLHPVLPRLPRRAHMARFL